MSSEVIKEISSTITFKYECDGVPLEITVSTNVQKKAIVQMMEQAIADIKNSIEPEEAEKTMD